MNMYEFVSKDRFNPLGGQCSHDCHYCFMKQMKRFPHIKEKYSGEPRLYEKEFEKKFKPNETVFVVDCADLFANNVPAYMIIKTLNYCQKFPETTFLFQSKNPARMGSYLNILPKNSILCTTIETVQNNEFMGNTPSISNRINAIRELSNYFKTQITVEPIMNFDLDVFVQLLRYSKAGQINLGCDSKKNHLPEPSKEKILSLIQECEKFTKVHQKENLKRLL